MENSVLFSSNRCSKIRWNSGEEKHVLHAYRAGQRVNETHFSALQRVARQITSSLVKLPDFLKMSARNSYSENVGITGVREN